MFDRRVRPKGDFSRHGNLALDNDLRGQVWRALAPLVGPPPVREPLFGRRRAGAFAVEPITDDEWRELRERVRALGGVHWDASTQRYAAGPRQ
ncbi:MAG: hypothetical protein L6Q99_10570 [Planctomycetes bacterium]|nr:hypothetical protein [Planctomycetota bacterium]